ncbi:MAG: acetyl-CoA hydrolase/transferase C-terminal domain-containing protein [Acidimicrobiales bacterium]
MEFVSDAIIAQRLESLSGDEPRVAVSGNFATPHHLLDILVATLPRCRLFVLNPQAGWPIREGLVTETPFVGPGVRNDPSADYLPMRLSLVPRLFAFNRPPDAVLVQTSAPLGGKVSLGIEVNIMPAAIEEVRRRGGFVIAQVNPQMPYTRGDGELNVELIDLAIEVDEPLPGPAEREVDEVAQRIGENVATLARDGSTLQMGIGALPDAALSHMHGLRDLGIWSEMISDGVLELERLGALDRSRQIISTFLFGSPELYEWAHDNPRLVMRRTETVNDPARIAEHPLMLAINTAIQIDLYAQANASYVRGRIYSGYGGQPDFVGGALHSAQGQSVLALHSWHDKSATSSVLPMLEVPATSFQHSVVVTENGIAPLFGRSQHAQARLLVEKAAHPKARDELTEAAKKLGLWREK